MLYIIIIVKNEYFVYKSVFYSFSTSIFLQDSFLVDSCFTISVTLNLHKFRVLQQKLLFVNILTKTSFIKSYLLKTLKIHLTSFLLIYTSNQSLLKEIKNTNKSSVKYKQLKITSRRYSTFESTTSTWWRATWTYSARWGIRWHTICWCRSRSSRAS